MKTSIICLCFFACFVSGTLNAQQYAITETGAQVILYDDGTWEYLDEEVLESEEIPTNSKKFEKSKDASFLVKSNRFDVGVWLDPKKWIFKKAVDNPDAEYEFQLKGEDLYGMMITEKVEIPIESFKAIALENGRSVAPDLKIIKEEYRNVNGLTVLMLQMNGSIQGIKVSYFGYYYSNENGSVQFITYTAQNLLKDYMPDCENLLNGFSLVK